MSTDLNEWRKMRLHFEYEDWHIIIRADSLEFYNATRSKKLYWSEVIQKLLGHDLMR